MKFRGPARRRPSWCWCPAHRAGSRFPRVLLGVERIHVADPCPDPRRAPRPDRTYPFVQRWAPPISFGADGGLLVRPLGQMCRWRSPSPERVARSNPLLCAWDLASGSAFFRAGRPPFDLAGLPSGVSKTARARDQTRLLRGRKAIKAPLELAVPLSCLSCAAVALGRPRPGHPPAPRSSPHGQTPPDPGLFAATWR